METVKKLIVPLVVVALLAAAALTLFRGGEDRKHLTASFPRTVSIYEGSDVRVLGVPVGEVESVQPAGDVVKVEMSYDAEVQVPADAQAVIIAPSVVGDRFVQLTPAYDGGRQLADGAVLDTDRTSTPLELDQVYESLDDLTVALGPNGANSKGALSDLLDTTAKNFDGQGTNVNQTIRNLGKFTGTLENNKEELFGSAAQIERFVKALARNDKVVRNFNGSIASVSEMLASERQELSTSLANLGTALGEVKTFVRDNKTLLGKNIKGLNRVSKTLVKRRGELDEILNVAPLALNNLALTYNPQSGTLDTAANFGNLPNEVAADPAVFLCTAVDQADPSGAACNVIKSIFPRPGLLGSRAVADPTFARLLEVAR
jgi:virulence factor Mce-like protein